MVKARTIFVISIILLLTKCAPEAPHDNPSDPYLTNSQAVLKFTGTVTTIYQPDPLFIKDVKVSIEPIGKYVYTDDSGKFEIDNLQENNYLFILEKEGYQTDSVNIHIDSENFSQGFSLNALPQITSPIKYYSVSGRFNGEPQISVFIEIEAEDPDGQNIDSAKVWIPEFGIRKSLQPILPDGTYRLTIEQDSIESIEFYNLIEYPMYIILVDQSRSKNIIGPHTIKHFILHIPQTISPANDEIASLPVLFHWDEVKLPYEYFFEINITAVDDPFGSPATITRSGIEQSSTEYIYNYHLNNGNYYWTITIKDEFNNSSESERAFFKIDE